MNDCDTALRRIFNSVAVTEFCEALRRSRPARHAASMESPSARFACFFMLSGSADPTEIVLVETSVEPTGEIMQWTRESFGPSRGVAHPAGTWMIEVVAYRWLYLTAFAFVDPTEAALFRLAWGEQIIPEREHRQALHRADVLHWLDDYNQACSTLITILKQRARTVDKLQGGYYIPAFQRFE